MTLPPPRPLKTKKRKVQAPGPSLIAQLPPGVWKIPPRRWILSLRRSDGEREIRTVRGDLLEARARRDVLMATGRYSMAWLIEDREEPRPTGPHKTQRPARDEDLR